jgi:hypothetical protein
VAIVVKINAIEVGSSLMEFEVVELVAPTS